MMKKQFQKRRQSLFANFRYGRELLNNKPPSGEIFHGRTVHDVPNKKIKEISNEYVSAFCAPPDIVMSVHRQSMSREHRRQDVSQMKPIEGIVNWNERQDFAYGMAMTLYESDSVSEHCVGDPIADALGVVTLPNCCILSLADGVSWGEKSKLASNCSVYGAVTYICKHIHTCTYTKDIFRCILRSFENAQNCIIESEATMTTLCVGVVVPLQEKDQFAFCVVNVGDSYAYVYNHETGVKEVTHGSHLLDQVRDMRYSGGALGPADGYNPDLGNLTCSFVVVDKGDIVFLASDGISDNFDPAIAKFTPRFKADELTNRLSKESSYTKLDKAERRHSSSMDNECTVTQGVDKMDGIKRPFEKAANIGSLKSTSKNSNESFEEIFVQVEEAPSEGDAKLEPSYKRDHHGSHDVLCVCDCSFADVCGTSSNEEDNDLDCHSDEEQREKQSHTPTQGEKSKHQNQHDLELYLNVGKNSIPNGKDSFQPESYVKTCKNCASENTQSSTRLATRLASDQANHKVHKGPRTGIRGSVSDNDIQSICEEKDPPTLNDDKTCINENGSKQRNSFVRRTISQPPETIGSLDVQDGRSNSDSITPTLTPRERHRGALEQMTQIIKGEGESEPIHGATITAMDVCARLMTFVVNRTAEKREILEEVAPKKHKGYDKAKISKKLEGVPGKLDHASIAAYEVGIHVKEPLKTVHTHSKIQADLLSTEFAGKTPNELRRASEPVESGDREFYQNPEDRKQLYPLSR